MVAPVASRRGCAALGRAVPRSGRAFGLADAPPDPCGSVGVMSCVRACLPRRWLASAWGRPAPLPDAVDGAAEGRAARRSTCTGARTSAGSLARGSARLPRRDARVPGQCMVLPRSVPRTRRGGLAGHRIAAARFPGSQRRPDRGRIRGRGRGQGMTSRPRRWLLGSGSESGRGRAVAGSGGGGEGAACRRLGCGVAGGRSAAMRPLFARALRVSAKPCIVRLGRRCGTSTSTTPRGSARQTRPEEEWSARSGWSGCSGRRWRRGRERRQRRSRRIGERSSAAFYAEQLWWLQDFCGRRCWPRRREPAAAAVLRKCWEISQLPPHQGQHRPF